MVDLSSRVETLARRLAAADGVTLEDAVARAIENTAREAGLSREPRRQSVEDMLKVGRSIAAMPLLDPRSPREIMDNLDA